MVFQGTPFFTTFWSQERSDEKENFFIEPYLESEIDYKKFDLEQTA